MFGHISIRGFDEKEIPNFIRRLADKVLGDVLEVIL